MDRYLKDYEGSEVPVPFVTLAAYLAVVTLINLCVIRRHLLRIWH